MRIGHYAPNIGEEGGIATYIRRTGDALSSRGHEVAFLGRDAVSASLPGECVDVSNDTSLFTVAENLALDILHLHKSVETLPADRVPTVRTMHGHQGGCPSGSRYLSRTDEPCDRDYSLTGCLWGHIVDRCGSMRPQNMKANFDRIHRELRQAKQISTYTVSRFLRERMLRAGCSAEELQTIHSPAPTVEKSFTPVPEKSPPRFLFLGRLVPHKGAEWLLRALPEVDVPVHVDIAGKGPQRPALETLADDLNVASSVDFHGWVEPTRVSSLMRGARAVVFPSVWHEPAGLISLEAAAHGRPLIASQVGGIPEYVDPDHATLVDAHDIGGLADTITTLATDIETANRRGIKGREAARSTFSMSSFLDRLMNFYDRARAPT